MTDTPNNERNKKPNPPLENESSGHMGAKESQVEQKKPPTTELGELSGRPLEKGHREAEDYDPVDEITPG
jgi:hypothetical protein